MRKLIAIGLVALAAVGGTLALALAQSQPVANVELRVWEDVNDPAVNYISARPAGQRSRGRRALRRRRKRRLRRMAKVATLRRRRR